MFDRFTVAAQMTLFAARAAVSELRDTEITPNHILLGLLRTDDGPLPRVFARAGMSYSAVRDELRSSDPSRASRPEVPTTMGVPFTEGASRLLEYAIAEADRLSQEDVATGHLLLGIMDDADSRAANLVKRHGITIEDIRAAVLTSTEYREHGAPPQHGVMVRLISDPAPVRRIERVRWLVEEVERLSGDHAQSRLLVDEVHGHLDALKKDVLDRLLPLQQSNDQSQQHRDGHDKDNPEQSR
jgi:hypothetical protein